MFGADTTTNFFKVGKCLERGAKTFDEMMFKDYPLLRLHNLPVQSYFFQTIRNVNPRYVYDHEAKRSSSPDPGKWVPVCVYGVIANDLKSFGEHLSKFVIGLQKYHGKTKIRVLLDSSKYMDYFYFELESRMYREYPDNTESSNMF